LGLAQGKVGRFCEIPQHLAEPLGAGLDVEGHQFATQGDVFGSRPDDT
jgi:hypothetical protein